MPTNYAIQALHRYFLWANRMRGHCQESIREQGPPPHGCPELMIWLSAPFAYACYWFATLYVVIEGMQKLGLTNSTLSKLLADIDKVEKLRRFRNGVYHYQKNYFDARTKDFLKESYTEWASKLHDALSEYFLDWYRSNGLDYIVLEPTDQRALIALTKVDGDDIEVILESASEEADK